MWLVNPYRFAVVAAYDSDAQAYITAVETADAQALETGVKDAINAFVVGCKADGIWTAIKASCIMAGARTRSGALVPLVGSAPTQFGTVGGWNYNRKTGLQGNGTDNYLNSNRNNNADPQNSHHLTARAELQSVSNQIVIGARSVANGIGGKLLGVITSSPAFRSSPSTDTLQSSGSATTGTPTLFGLSRSLSTGYVARVSGGSSTISSTSTTPASANLFVFAQSTAGSPTVLSSARLSFYSIGESLDLALLDARVTTLINAFAAAIP
jgi:hypothetical protein